jgi:hypothetical protein
MDNKQNIQERWRDICQEYLKLFCDKHEYSFEDCFWVTDNYGTIACVSDMFISMEHIRYDIDNNIEETKFEKWYWKAIEIFELTGQDFMNYESFCKGAPDIWTEEKIEKLREAHMRVYEAEEALRQEIEEMTEEL